MNFINDSFELLKSSFTFRRQRKIQVDSRCKKLHFTHINFLFFAKDMYQEEYILFYEELQSFNGVRKPNAKDKEKLKKIFDDIDTDGSGELDVSELRAALANCRQQARDCMLSAC